MAEYTIRSRPTLGSRSQRCSLGTCSLTASAEIYAFRGENCLGPVGAACTICSPLLNPITTELWLAVARKEFGCLPDSDTRKTPAQVSQTF